MNRCRTDFLKVEDINLSMLKIDQQTCGVGYGIDALKHYNT